MEWTPIEVAIALSLYGYNIDATTRARRLYEHFAGECDEIDGLVQTMKDYNGAYVATGFALPTAKVYVEHALERYGLEARARIKADESK